MHDPFHAYRGRGSRTVDVVPALWIDKFCEAFVCSWVSYGLGTENDDLPAFVSIAPSVGNGGPRNYGSAFLPAKYQGTSIGMASTEASNLQMENLTAPDAPWGSSREQQRRQLDFIQSLNREQLARRTASGLNDTELEAVLES